jgi:hypothetical protein
MASTRRKYQFFIAHAGRDTNVAVDLYDRLLARGFSAFVDARCLKPGDVWDDILPAVQAASEVTVLLVSAYTDKAWYQRDEIEAAIALARKHPRSRRVVPVYLSDDNQIATPAGLRRLHAIRSHEMSMNDIVVALTRDTRPTLTAGPQRRRDDQSSVRADDAGLVAYHPVYPMSKMIESMRTAKHEILILQTWISNWNHFWIAFEHALRFRGDHGEPRSRLKIRVILIDPESPFCKARGIHSGHAPQATRRIIEAIGRSRTELQRQVFIERPAFRTPLVA